MRGSFGAVEARHGGCKAPSRPLSGQTEEIPVFALCRRCHAELKTIDRVSGPAGALLGASMLALLIGGALARLA